MKLLGIQRIWAIVLRHMYMQWRDAMRVFDVTFWPLLDTTLWGFVGFSMKGASSDYIPPYFLPLIGIFLWQIIVRGSVDLTVSMLEELWSKNLSNLLSSPITIVEWILGLIFVGIVRSMFVLILCGGAIAYLYDFNVLVLGWWLVPSVGLLLCSGWSMALFSSALIFRWGQRLQTFAWAAGWAFVVFSGALYSTDILPRWMQNISIWLPMTYVFKGIREFAIAGVMPTHYLYTSLWLNILFGIIAILLFNYMYKRAKMYGLARLEVD